MRNLTAAERAARAGIVYPPASCGKYPVICRTCGWADVFNLPAQRRRKAWAHVKFHESNDLSEWKM